MDPVYKAYFHILESLHNDCRAQISGMTEAELGWSPAEGMNSMAVLIAHIAGAERYWIGDVVMGETSNRDRDQEFTTSGKSEEVLSGMLDSALGYCREAFGRLTRNQLAEVRTSPRDGREYSVAWSIAHVLEHTALHLGHLQITKQLLDSLNDGSRNRSVTAL
jgi:uncharacterized damage-inducible protein DinB